ncbi:LysR family transcriptional regulator [Novilysobacter arseniciresistens]|uniref:LysR family transcriptional regulator n=1 Tax=Novilysobacter arseniciresistens TaxID=1385522 RepID=UPI0006910F9C|nr:LysR family transcriptional regulator [Lysobacter arseniciresistens]
MGRDLNETLVFATVAERGSFIAAARALSMPRTTVSRKVQELESRLGAQLLHRTTRSLGLTDAGHVYLAHARRICRGLEEAEHAIGQLQDGPRGWLRFAAPYDVGITWVAPLLGEFHARHPGVRVEMTLGTDEPGLIDTEFDLALRIGDLPDSSLVARRLAVFRTQVYASHDYITRHGEPRHPDDLQRHRTVSLPLGRRNDGFAWPLAESSAICQPCGVRPLCDYRIHPVLVANDFSGLKGALLSGEGLMLACDITIKAHVERDQVRHVLPGWVGPDLALTALFPRGRVPSPKVRAFVDFLVERLTFDADYVRRLCPADRIDTGTGAGGAANDGVSSQVA